jgi:hypothetical protein
MPRFDGTGPRGEGPMSGRGQGYCVLEPPDRGYVGLASTPVRLPPLASWLRLARHLAPLLFPAMALGLAFRRGQGRSVRRVAGRWSVRRSDDR